MKPAFRGSKALVSLPKSCASAAALTIRRLEAQLTEAEAKIAELRASAETDFLLDILNRRGFARELTRAVAFIARYGGDGCTDCARCRPPQADQ
jgi:PleD family two-component response regulator